MRNISGDKSLKEVLAEKIPQEQEIVKAFRKSHGSTKVGEVTVDMVSTSKIVYAKKTSARNNDDNGLNQFECVNKLNLIMFGRHASITYHMIESILRSSHIHFHNNIFIGID